MPGATHCPAVCCGIEKLVACVNGGQGGRLIVHKLRGLPFDLIQEWGFDRKSFEDLGEVVKGERILHAVADTSRRWVVGITPQHLFTVDLGIQGDSEDDNKDESESLKIEIVGEITGSGRIAAGSDGHIFGFDPPDHLWRYDPRTRTITRRAVALPEGSWAKGRLRWARDPVRGLLYLADDQGNLFSFSPTDGFSPRLGRTQVAPVETMAVTFDGRVFGFCGPELSRMFCYAPRRRELTDLGVAASVIERRRYGYTFGDAVTGRDGQIIFGEDDNLGHLWLYFPRIQSSTS